MLSIPPAMMLLPWLDMHLLVFFVIYLLPLARLIASFPFLKIAATCDLPITLARCSPTVRICIFLAKGFLTFLTFATVFLASVGVANFIRTVSLGFSSVYNLLPEPLGFFPVPFFWIRHVILLLMF